MLLGDPCGAEWSVLLDVGVVIELVHSDVGSCLLVHEHKATVCQHEVAFLSFVDALLSSQR